MSTKHKFDLIATGALNFDHIVGRTAYQRLALLDPPRLEGLRERLSGDPDARIDAHTVQEIIELMKDFDVTCLGGSGFNTLRTVRALGPHLRLGYIGVLAAARQGDSDFAAWFRHHRVDQRFIMNEPGEQGACASLFDKGSRRLRCCTGVDGMFSDQFRHRLTELVGYLSRAAILHLTPVMDDRGPALLVECLEAMKASNAHTIISLDPGYLWSRAETSALRKLYEHAGVLLVNEPEFRSIAEEPLRPLGRELIDSFVSRRHPASPLTIVIKRETETIVYEFDGLHSRIQAYPIEDLLSADQIEDATCAGDVLAGGFLAARFLFEWSVPASVALGHCLMWAKLRGVGLLDDQFAEILRP